MRTKHVKIVNKLGLHARAAKRLVQIAKENDCHVTLCANGRQANGKSIMEVMMLAAAQNCTMKIQTAGKDETTAMEQLSSLVRDRFGEDE